MNADDYIICEKKTVDKERNTCANAANALLSPDNYIADADKRSISVSFEVKQWEINRNGVLHGGVAAMMIDYTAGLCAELYSGDFCLTLSLLIKYIKSAEAGDVLVCNAETAHLGERSVIIDAEIRNSESNKLISKAYATFVRP